MKREKDNTKEVGKDKQLSLIEFFDRKGITNQAKPSPNKKVQETLQIKNQKILGIQLKKRSNDTHAEEKNQRKDQSNRSHTDQLSSLSALSARSSSPQVIVQKKVQKISNINVKFYMNEMPSQPNGQYIDKMHKFWEKDYVRLQRDHSFIQWIFPNSFQSRFNHHAKPLSKQQAQQFRTNPQIYLRYLKSYDMILGFYGMRLKDRHTGEIVRSRNPDYKQRMYKTLLTSFHNHMRITRILCSLTETGFGKYAVQLCKFIKYQIQSPNGFMNSLKRYNVYKDWAPFQNYQEKPENTNLYLQKINKKYKEIPTKTLIQHPHIPQDLKDDHLKQEVHLKINSKSQDLTKKQE